VFFEVALFGTWDCICKNVRIIHFIQACLQSQKRPQEACYLDCSTQSIINPCQPQGMSDVSCRAVQSQIPKSKTPFLPFHPRCPMHEPHQEYPNLGETGPTIVTRIQS